MLIFDVVENRFERTKDRFSRKNCIYRVNLAKPRNRFRLINFKRE